MTYPDTIPLDLDPSGYIQGLGQAEAATAGFAGTLRATAVAMSPMQRAMDMVTPSRMMLGGVTAVTYAAARQQQQMAQLNATTKVTGANYAVLAKGTDQLARTLPIGNAGARELVTQMTRMGIAAKGNERQIVSLSKSFTQLSGATGEGPVQLAQGMVQLNRAMSTGTNTDRISKLSDSLTSISAQSGASAVGILQFSRSIAPMAQASGIGETKVMGISAAFAKLGEDGYAGANAFTKMLTDLNRSVREGSPTMASYAQIVGKTTGEFQDLFKANPAEALTQITEALGKSSNAPRLLDQLGLDGVRTQRSLQMLAQSGGLRESIATSVDAYGGGSTERGAKGAFEGLNDSLTRLRASSEQLAEAFGRPFLGAVTHVSDVMAGITRPALGLANSGLVQHGLAAASTIGLPLLMARRLVGPMVTAAGFQQVLTSGPVAGAMGGYARSGAPLNRLAGFLGGNTYNQLQAAGTQIGSDRMQGMIARGERFGVRMGNLLDRPGTGPGLLSQLRTVGVGGAAMLMRASSEQLRLARTPFAQRDAFLMRPFGQEYKDFSDRARGAIEDRRMGYISSGESTKQIRTAFNDLARTTGGVSNSFKTLSMGALAVGREMSIYADRNAGRAVVGAGRMAYRGLNALTAGMGGPVGVGLMAAMVGFQVKQSSDRIDAQRQDEARNSTSWIDDMRVAMGKATQATSTFAGQMASANKAQAQALTMDQALTVSPDDYNTMRAAGSKKRVINYSGMSPAAAARRIGVNAQGANVQADDLRQIEQDLALSGFSREEIQQIVTQVSPGLSGGGTTSSTGDIGRRVQDLSKGNAGGFRHNVLNRLDINTGLGRITGGGTPSKFTIEDLSKEQVGGSRELARTIADQNARTSATYGAEYANKQSYKQIDEAIRSAFKHNNADLAERLQKDFQASMGMDTEYTASEAQLRQYGGSFTAGFAAKDKGFRTGLYTPAMKVSDDQPDASQGWIYGQLAGNPLQALFGNDPAGLGPAARRAQQSTMNLVGPNGAPESPHGQAETLQATIAAAREMGMSMTDLAIKSADAANNLAGAGDAATELQRAVTSAAQFQLRAAAVGQTTAQAAMAQGQTNAGFASVDPKNDVGGATRQAGLEGLISGEEQAVQTVAARLKQQQQYQFQSRTMQADYVRQGVWQEKDYQLQLVRVDEDYTTARTRANQQQTLQIQDATDDFHRQQLRSHRDFAKQMRRTSEDAARSMYEPYERIQVKPTWDAFNLAGNLQEQNEAIAQQLGNLKKLRSAGGGTNLIELLGLNDPKNAQQLAGIVDDLARDPKILDTLNRSANARQQLGGQLANDRDNIPMARSREDFAQQTADVQKDFGIGLTRMRRNFGITMDQMAFDHARGLKRAEEDRKTSLDRAAQQYATTVDRMHAQIKMADQEITTKDLPALTKALNEALNGQFVDFQTLTTSGMAGWVSVLEQYSGKWQELILSMGTDLKITVDTNPQPGSGSPNTTRGAGHAMDPSGGGDGIGMGYKAQAAVINEAFPGLHAAGDPGRAGKTVSGNVSYHTQGRAVDISPPSMDVFDWIAAHYPNSRELIYTPAGRGQIKDGQSHVYSDVVARGHYDHIHWAMAKGGIATGPTRALIGEAGDNEAVIPLNRGGVQVLASAMTQFLSQSDARAMQAARYATHIVYDSSTTYIDKGQTFTGDITVLADDPGELGAALAEKKRSDNLTAPQARRR